MDGLLGYDAPMDEVGVARPLLNTAYEVMDVRSARWIRDELSQVVGQPIPAGVRGLEIRGRLLVDSDRAYARLSPQADYFGHILLLRRSGNDDVALAIPGRLPRSAGRSTTALILFAVTLLSVLWAGASYEGAGRELDLRAGIPFAVSLLGILLAHEMGHYLVARWQGVPASLPYFIPFPLSPLGTMGAVIQTKAPPRNRRALLWLGASGPLAGMVVALPVLIYGLATSQVHVPLPGPSYQEGNSLLYAGLKLMVLGRFLPSGGEDVILNSVAWAGWAGLLVTALNLIPAGQLDGGHIAYALLGRRARWLTWGVVAILLALSPLWQGWLLWVGLVLLLGRVHSVPLDDVTPLGARERAIGALAIVLFVLVFAPIPLDVVVH